MNAERSYGNYKVFSPDNILMFHTNKRKLNFYLKNDLIDQISEKEYRLKFAPNGLGHSEINRNPLLLLPRENRCVVSGETDIINLTKHHIVPSVFRRHFPDERKSNNFLFVVLITRKNHDLYTNEEHKFYDVIANEYGIPPLQHTTEHFHEKMMGMRVANTLLKHGHKIPYDKFMLLKKQFEELTGMATPDSQSLNSALIEYSKSADVDYQKADFNFGKQVVTKIEDYDAFEKRWLTHFIDTMKPKYLPLDLQQYLKL